MRVWIDFSIHRRVFLDGHQEYAVLLVAEEQVLGVQPGIVPRKARDSSTVFNGGCSCSSYRMESASSRSRMFRVRGMEDPVLSGSIEFAPTTSTARVLSYLPSSAANSLLTKRRAIGHIGAACGLAARAGVAQG